MKHIFVINPIAGVKNQLPEVLKDIEVCFKSRTYAELEYVIYETKSEGDATIFVKEYINTHLNEELRFYACGGDGTLNEVVNGVFGYENTQVACLPIGSGNDFLKYFGFAKDFRKIENLIDGEVVSCDLIKINDRYVVNIFNVGVDANVAVYQKKLKKLPFMSGSGAYTFGVVFAFLGRICNKFTITVDDEVIYNGKATLCAVANAICYGGGYYCTPNAIVNDNLIDVCLVKKVSRMKFVSLVKKYKAGKHLEDPKVTPYIIYKQGKKVQIEIERVLSYSIDGEIGRAKQIVLEVINNGFKFVIPKVSN